MNETIRKPSATAMRNAARLMAVQAVYQMMIAGKSTSAALVAEEYLSLRQNMEVEGETLIAPDDSLFRNIVLGVAERGADLKDIVTANRNAKEGQVRVNEPLLEAVLLCGTYELLSRQDIDFPVIISSYVDVAKAFFGGAEPNLVNAVLDSIRKVTRA